VPLDFQPGTLWRYSGLAGFDVLSRVVEVVSKQPFDEYLRERIFEPLDMRDTSFYYTGRQAERLASVHARRDGKLEATPRDLSNVKYFSGAGGLSASLFSHTIGAPPIAAAGSEELKRRVLPSILAGEKISALAITERSPAERFLEPAVRENLRVISEKLVADAAQPEPIRRFAEGIACLDQSRWNCAIAALRAASAADRQEQVAPLLGLALFERGGEQLRAGNDAAAVPDLSEAARLRPHDARVHVELGVALVRVGRPGKARSEFAKFRIYDLPQGDFYRSALESGNDADRVIALAAARAILRQFPRDPLAREAVQLLAK